MDHGPLPGGRSNPGAVFRQGNTVVRPLGDAAWVEVLRRVTEVFPAAPGIVALDDRTVTLEWQEGDAPQDLADPPLSRDATVAAVGALLRRLHDATAPLAKRLPAIRTGLGDPTAVAEVVCHGDPLPGNVIFRGGRPAALIDWEHAARGRRAWDLAVALRWWSPLRAPENLRPGEERLDATARARLLLDGYGADRPLRSAVADLLAQSQRVAAANAIAVVSARGDDAYRRWADRGGERRLAADEAWFADHLVALRVILTG